MSASQGKSRRLHEDMLELIDDKVYMMALKERLELRNQQVKGYTQFADTLSKMVELTECRIEKTMLQVAKAMREERRGNESNVGGWK